MLAPRIDDVDSVMSLYRVNRIILLCRYHGNQPQNIVLLCSCMLQCARVLYMLKFISDSRLLSFLGLQDADTTILHTETHAPVRRLNISFIAR